MTHLGERVSALVDGQLPIDALERAHSHLARCRECRDAVEAERLMKVRLSCLPEPGPEAGFLGRLVAIGAPQEASVESSSALLSSAFSTPALSAPGESLASGGPLSSARPVPGGPLRSSRRPSGRGSSRRPGPAGSHGLAGSPRAGGSTRPLTGPRSPSGGATVRFPGRLFEVGKRRARLAGAVLGALGVVGAGISGLLLVSPGVTDHPARVPLDSFVVQRPSLSVNPGMSRGIVASTASTHSTTSTRSTVSPSPSVPAGGTPVDAGDR
ncbi:MAG: hypothetical protein QG622_3667 [Actinomycetota bacterium]|nr:hypothetical protein [Actinomycetota bacterium]